MIKVSELTKINRLVSARDRCYGQLRDCDRFLDRVSQHEKSNKDLDLPELLTTRLNGGHDNNVMLYGHEQAREVAYAIQRTVEDQIAKIDYALHDYGVEIDDE